MEPRSLTAFIKSRRPRGWLRKAIPLPIEWPKRPVDYRTPGKYFFYTEPTTGKPTTGEVVRVKLDSRNTFTVALDDRGEPIAVLTRHADSDSWYGVTGRHVGLERRTETELAHALATEPP